VVEEARNMLGSLCSLAERNEYDTAARSSICVSCVDRMREWHGAISPQGALYNLPLAAMVATDETICAPKRMVAHPD